MRLRALGGLSVEETVYRREKPLLLLAYLCVEGAQPRRRLASLFWPEASNPMNSLAQHLIRLRPLGGVVLEDGGRVEARLECDVGLFRAHTRAGRHAEALEVYGGPFLDGLGVTLGPDLEEWLFETREALGREARAAHLTLAERRLALGDPTGAATGAERAYAVPGASPPDPADLLRLYRLLQPAGHPLADTVRREADELEVPLTSAPTPAVALTLLGRSGERAALEALGPGQVAWVSGPAGIGKSTLLAALAAAGGWRVLPGRPGLPLATLEPLAPRLTGTADTLAALSDSRLRVALDGWEDADEATRAALTLAARQRPGAALVIAARDPPALPTDLHLTLGPLAPAELSAHPGAFEATAGHPALMAAFLRGAPPDQTLDAHLNALSPPAREVYLMLALQPAPDLAATRAALRLPAAEFAGTLDRLNREGLCTPEGEVRTPGTAREVLDAQAAHTTLRHLHLARAHQEGKGWVHWQAARTLWEEEDHPAAARAAHAHASEEMKRGYPAHAAATLEGAPQTGEVRLLRAWALIHSGRMPKALEILERLPETPDVRAALATALLRAGRHTEANRLVQHIPRDGGLAHAHAETILGHLARREELWQEARMHFQKSINLWNLHGDDQMRFQTWSHLCTVQVRLGFSMEQAFHTLLSAVENSATEQGSVYNNYAQTLQLEGQMDMALHYYALSLQAFQSSGDNSGAASALNNLGVILHLQNHINEARQYYQDALHLCRQTGDLLLLGAVASNLSEIENDVAYFTDTLALLEDAGHHAFAKTIRDNLLTAQA